MSQPLCPSQVKKLVLLVESFFVGFKNAIWVFTLLLLALYVFAVMAVEMFGRLGLQPGFG